MKTETHKDIYTNVLRERAREREREREREEEEEIQVISTLRLRLFFNCFKEYPKSFVYHALLILY